MTLRVVVLGHREPVLDVGIRGEGVDVVVQHLAVHYSHGPLEPRTIERPHVCTSSPKSRRNKRGGGRLFRQTLLAAPPVTGSAANVLPALTQAAEGELAAEGAVAQTLPVLTQSASGSVQSGITGTATSTLPMLTQDAAGVLAVAGAAEQALSALVNQAAGVASAEAVVAQLLPALEQDLQAQVSVAGESIQTLPVLSQEAEGFVGDVLVGDIASVLPALSAAIEGGLTVGGDGASILSPLGSDLVGRVWSASGAVPPVTRLTRSDLAEVV